MRQATFLPPAPGRSSGVPAYLKESPRSWLPGAGESRCWGSSNWGGGSCMRPFVAVTGTNGKTTTTEWIGHIHREAGLPVQVVGNVGTAVSSLAEEDVDPASTIVCEASSFQLEDTEAFAPEGAVLLNLSPDHLDRHATYEDYVAAKLRIFAHQRAEDLAVLPAGLEVEIGGQARQVRYGSGPELELAQEIAAAGGTQPPERACGGGAVPGPGAPRGGRGPGFADLSGRASPSGAGQDARRRELDQRLQSHQRGQHDRGAAGAARRSSSHRRGAGKGSGLRSSDPARGRALPGSLPDR